MNATCYPRCKPWQRMDQNCACSFAGIVAPILIGWLLQKTGRYEAPMVAILVLLLVGVLSYLFLVSEKRAPFVK